MKRKTLSSELDELQKRKVCMYIYLECIVVYFSFSTFMHAAMIIIERTMYIEIIATQILKIICLVSGNLT